MIINEWHNVDDAIGIGNKRIIGKLIVNIIIIIMFFLFCSYLNFYLLSLWLLRLLQSLQYN